MSKLLLIFLTIILCGSSWAQGEYAISNINPLLLKEANAIKRFENIRFEIKSAGKATYYHKTAVTILNEAGAKYSGLQESYDRFHKINYIEGYLYDAYGKKVKSVKNKDISDISAVGESLIGDGRIKEHNFYHKSYPYTVEYEVELDHDELMFIPDWMPVKGQNLAVEKSVFEVLCSPDYNIRYKAFNYGKDAVITNTGKKKTYHWEASNMQAITAQFASPPWEELTTSVFIAPTVFEIEGYKGVMTSWLELGKFQSELNRNRDILPANIKTIVHNLTDTISDVKRKIEVLYAYMQKNTRYISIQLGIGGWQPLEASFVANKGYGDCKALTNYMHSLLKEAGINAYYTLIKAGDNNYFYLPDFPSRQSNHVILSVPVQNDTIWLECTSNTLPAGYLSGFTSNRFALMIKDDGGYLVHTPSYIDNQNLQVRNISATLDETGKLDAKISTRYTGLQQDDLHQILHAYTKKEQLEYLKKEIDLPTYDIESFDYTETKSAIPFIDEKLDLTAQNYAQISGKRVFLQPNLLSQTSVKLDEGDRKYDIDLKYGFRNIDNVEMKIPAGYIPEAFPKNVSLKNKFGVYNINYEIEGEKITMTRNFERKAGRFPASDYSDLTKFYKDIYKADRSKIVLVKKEG